MKIALMQMNIIWEDKGQNLQKAEELLIKAANEACDVAVFPEMFTTGFSMNNAEIAEKPNGFLLNKLKKLAVDYKISIIGGMAEMSKKSGTQFENRAYVLNPEGEISAQYTKNYGFSYSGEDQKYQSGDTQVLFELNGIKSSVFICYDLRFPELFRKVADSVSLIFVIANWPESRIEQWVTLLKARAIENQCFVIGVNRIGKDDYGLVYNGQSMVIDPVGMEVEPVSSGDEIIIVEMDEKETAFVRERFPFLKDRKS